MQINPDRDVVLDRVLNAPPSLVWRCWTEPELFCQWYGPQPGSIVGAKMDLRPGGQFWFAMAGPDGQSFPNEGCFLEVVPEQKLVFTDLMTADYAPVPEVNPEFGPAFTVVLTFAPEGNGTRYRAIARHRSAAEAKLNNDMGFAENWAGVAENLNAFLVKLGG
mgnify:FL=1